jgi:hypothetical protein
MNASPIILWRGASHVEREAVWAVRSKAGRDTAPQRVRGIDIIDRHSERPL